MRADGRFARVGCLGFMFTHALFLCALYTCSFLPLFVFVMRSVTDSCFTLWAFVAVHRAVTCAQLMIYPYA